MAESFYPGTEEPAAYFDEEGPLSLGTALTPALDGLVTRGRWHWPDASPVDVTYGLYRIADSVLLGSQAWPTSPAPTLEAWNEFDLTAPIPVRAGVQYIPTVFTSAGRYPATPHYFDDPITRGDLAAPAAAGKYTGGSPITLPASQFNQASYLVDWVFVPTAERHNIVPNPSAKVDTSGYGGTVTNERATDVPSGSPRTTGVRATSNGYLLTPVAPCSPGQTTAISFYGWNDGAFFEFGKTVYVSYTRSGGGDTFPQTFGLQLGDIGNVARAEFVTDPAQVPADVTGIYLVWDAIGPGYTMSALMMEPVSVVGSYGDGDTPGWSWDGTDGLSASTLLLDQTAEGSAAFTLDLAAGATGARPSSGAAALALALDPAAAGARASAGASAFALGLDPAAAGARTSGGSAALRLGLHAAASGAGEVSCLPFPWACSAVPGFGACGDLPALPGTCVPVPSFSEVAP